MQNCRNTASSTVFGRSGHNRRTCVAAKVMQAIQNEGNSQLKQAAQDCKDDIIDTIMSEIAEEGMMEAIEFATDVFIPGLGTSIKLGRYGWKLLNR